MNGAEAYPLPPSANRATIGDRLRRPRFHGHMVKEQGSTLQCLNPGRELGEAWVNENYFLISLATSLSRRL